ncbi:MAG TPA: ParB/RepB/Spo0J family partition protein, partial [Pedococcus sp.]|nr:ParB/RepB/Spo0J family partition protein [Pedococcus sp.]
MSEKRRALGRGLGALIPNAPANATSRPVDVFFPDQRPATTDGDAATEPGAADATTNGAGTTSGGQQDGTSGPVGEATPGSAKAEAAEQQDGVPQEAQEPADTGLAPVPGASYGEIPLDEIRPNPRQPRSVFDEDDMAELVHSIREIGVLQPVVVRPVSAGRDGDVPEGVRYELIMGERRWRASREAGKETVPAIVKETEDDDLLRDALLENLHRSQLNPLEEAAAYSQLLEDFGCTHDELAGRIGRSRPQISNTLRLLKLPPMVARRVAAGVLSAGHARALLSLEDGGAMERLAQRIVAEGLSVRSVEEIVALGADLGEKAK